MSARGTSSAFVTALQQPHVAGGMVFAELGFAGGSEYAVTCDFPVTYGGITWLASYGLMGIGTTTERAGSYDGVEIQISGVPSSALSLALSERVQGRPCKLRMGVLNAGGLIADDNVWSGTMDQMRLKRGADGQEVISITAEHQMASWDRARPRRWTDAEQQALYPGDTACRHVKDAERKVAWPSAEFFKQ